VSALASTSLISYLGRDPWTEPMDCLRSRMCDVVPEPKTHADLKLAWEAGRKKKPKKTMLIASSAGFRMGRRVSVAEATLHVTSVTSA
jgi:hypothetical protein